MTESHTHTFTQVPNELLEIIMFGDFPPMLKALAWVLRNTFGWNRTTWEYTKSLQSWAIMMQISYKSFIRALRTWEYRGLIELDTQNCIVEIVYPKMSTLSTQKCIDILYKNVYPAYPKMSTQKCATPTTPSSHKGLNKDFKQRSKKRSQTKVKKVCDESINHDLLRLKSYVKNVPRFCDIDFDPIRKKLETEELYYTQVFGVLKSLIRSYEGREDTIDSPTSLIMGALKNHIRRNRENLK